MPASQEEQSTAVLAGGDVVRPPTFESGEPPRGRMGRYELIGRLGRGGMADVFLALSTSPVGDVHKLAVIKRVREVLRDDPDFIRMFLDEARISARINHPNVVHTYAVEVDDGVPLIVMEYLDGVALSALVKPLTGGTWRDRLPLVWALSQALIGLHHVHEFKDYDGRPLGLVHRDIKPANIFVTFEGQVKVLDFGVAKSTNITADTASHSIKGTARYMAPEMVVEGLVVDRRTDVFSCGIVLSELLAGRALWQNLTPLQILRRLADNDVPQIATVEAGIPPALAAICERALHPDPASRHATAAELRQEIEAFLRTQSDPPTAEGLAAIVVGNYDEQRQRRARVIRERMERTGRPSIGGIEELIPVIWTPGSISDRPAAPRRSWIPYGLVGAAGIGLAVIAYAVGAGGSAPADPPAPKADPVPAEAPPAAKAEVAPVVDAPDPRPTPVVDVVELRAAASPPTATLYLDGEPLDGNPAVVSIPRNDVARRVEARAEGYETRDAEVVPDDDREVVLKLTRSKAGKARPRKPKPPDARSDKLDIERESPW